MPTAAIALPTQPSVLLTREDYQKLPGDDWRYQLVEGELVYTAAAPNRFHQDISRNIEFTIVSYLKDHPIGVIYDAPFDVFLDDINVHQPDLVFIANDQLSILTDAGAEGAPTFVVEILSPGTAKLDREKKIPVLARNGVDEFWLVDPLKKAVRIYHLQEDASQPFAVHISGDTFTSRTFPSLVFSTDKIFKA